jgi:hypothetical protein
LADVRFEAHYGLVKGMARGLKVDPQRTWRELLDHLVGDDAAITGADSTITNQRAI